MPKQIIIAEQHRIAAVFAEDQIQELVVATGSHQVGDIYLGIVENVLPGIDAAFVNIGDSERNGFIHVTDLGPLRLKRSAGAITELLTPQQKVLVQVMKEPTGTKGPRLTGNITLPGRYLVLMPYGRGVNLSRRIRSETERNRLRALAILVKPAGMGLLVRTEAENVAEEAIMEDLEALQRQWEAIQHEAASTRAPALLNRDDDFIQRVLRDMYSGDVNRIVVDSHTGVKRVKQQITIWSGGRPPQGVLIDHHRDRIPLLEYFRVNAAIREALKPRVDLPSGGYIIIEPTEALTVIDVNSGSFTRSATARETVLWTNCEAATEIARQLRLRNIAGVIVVDFIDMDSHKDQLQVLEHFNKALRADKARPQIAQLSELGLVELTRKRQGQNIYELFGHSCPTCNGLGHLAHLPGETEGPQALVERSASGLIREPIATRNAESRASETRFNETPYEPRRIDRPERNPSPDYEGSRSPYEIPRSPQEGPRPPYEGSRSFTARNITRPEIPSLPEPAPWQNDSDDYEGNDLDLTNHPSYQERGNFDRKRTRRRRRIGEEEQGTMGRGLGIDSELSSMKIDPPIITTPRNNWDEKPERSRPMKKQIGKPVPTPPEIVTVAMTPEEQDIYALMGVSPLVLADHEVRNPKSAVVEITLPGEGTTRPPLPRPVLNDVAEADGGDSEESEEGSVGFENHLNVELEMPYIASIQPEEPLEERSEADVPEENSFEEPASAMSDSSGLIDENRRRRRRRSSTTPD